MDMERSFILLAALS